MRIPEGAVDPERASAYQSQGLWDDVTLPDQVRRWAHERSNETAVVDHAGTRRHTWSQLAEDAGTLAAALEKHGVGPGDVVSVQLPNGYEAVVAAVSVLSIGGVLNPLLPNYRARELGHVFRSARPKAILTPDVYRGFDHRMMVAEVSAETGQTPVHFVVGENGGDARIADILAAPTTAAPVSSPRAGDISELLFSSGTEAQPKAILHTEQTTNCAVRTAYTDLGMSQSDVVWMPSPIGHSTGFNYGLRFALYHGLRLVLQDEWNPESAVDLIEQEQCSYTLAATTFLNDLLPVARRDPSRVRSLVRFGCGGASVPPELVAEADGLGIRVLRLYGSTEVLVGTWNRPGAMRAKRMHTDGSPMSHVEIECRRDDGTVCDPEEPGEIFTRGPSTCVGLFDDPERTRAIFDSEGWVRSGDLGTVDAEGYLSVVGRKKEIIIRGGLNIAPREIEELILRFPEVDRVAVVGLPHPRLGELSCACVMLRPGSSLSLDEMSERLLAEGLAKYKLPERLERLDSLPVTASGKTQKHEIVRILSEVELS
jgi:cyclohexanecarboxylate-CoA ligase